MKKIWLLAATISLLASCKDKDPVLVPDPTSEGKQMQLEGNTATHSGTAAGNSVFVDFSKDKVATLERQSWDLGFYCGPEFRVIINNTTAAMALVTDKYSLAEVSAADTVGVPLYFSLSAVSPELFQYFDDVEGKISGTVIPEIHSDDAANKVIILNRGNAGGIDNRDFYKLKINRSGSDYQIQYAPIDAVEFETVTVSKDNNWNFQLLSLDNGLIVEHPQKDEWDIQWTLSVYKTQFGTDEYVPYAFSDMVETNFRHGTTVAAKNYASEEEARIAFDEYSAADALLEDFENNRWGIGATWRRTAAPGSSLPEGVIKTSFYVIKDHEGNVYKLKFLSFSSADGGERGRPELKYVLVN